MIRKYHEQSLIIEHTRNKPQTEVVLDSMIDHANAMLRQAKYIREVVEEGGFSAKPQ